MASQKLKTPDQTLKVSTGNMVCLTIFAGNMHIASSTVKFMGTSDILHAGEITSLKIGKGEDLVGKTLRVVGRVIKQGPSPKIALTEQFTNATPAKTQFTGDSFEPGNIFFTYTTDYTFTN